MWPFEGVMLCDSGCEGACRLVCVLRLQLIHHAFCFIEKHTNFLDFYCRYLLTNSGNRRNWLSGYINGMTRQLIETNENIHTLSCDNVDSSSRPKCGPNQAWRRPQKLFIAKPTRPTCFLWQNYTKVRCSIFRSRLPTSTVYELDNIQKWPFREI